MVATKNHRPAKQINYIDYTVIKYHHNHLSDTGSLPAVLSESYVDAFSWVKMQFIGRAYNDKSNRKNFYLIRIGSFGFAYPGLFHVNGKYSMRSRTLRIHLSGCCGSVQRSGMQAFQGLHKIICKMERSKSNTCTFAHKTKQKRFNTGLGELSDLVDRSGF